MQSDFQGENIMRDKSDCEDRYYSFGEIGFDVCRLVDGELIIPDEFLKESEIEYIGEWDFLRYLNKRKE